MKKTLLSIAIIAISTFSLLAQVNRELVLVEIGTGTWCTYCPGAAMGAHDLMTNGDPVAVVENHNGDSFTTTDSDARNSYYSISGYPTAKFDGNFDQYVGGSSSQSMYSNYLPKVNARMAIQTDFTVEILGDNIGDNYSIIVRVVKVGSYTGTNLQVRFALTETDIPFNWLGQTTVDYTNRLMVPDANGTTVSFGSGNQVDVNLNFTFNNTWVDSNCELIAWIQDDDDKYVQHTASVMMLALQPDVAGSNFSCSNTTTCEGGAVQFNDESTGAITSWDWTFEGGTPATSTDQNPLVSYNTQGVYDVTLYVSDGTTNSTLTHDDMIEAIVAPVQPDAPVGEMEACANGSYIYTTQPVPYSDSYSWEVSPADAGTIIGDGTEVTFESEGSWTGTYTITVRADNSCGDGTWSAPLNCELFFTPDIFQLSEGGGICEGGPGLEVILDGSETGVDYELYRDAVYTGTSLPGTGSSLNYGFQTEEGTYTVIGYAAVCELQQMGTPWIHYLETPAQPSTPAGSTAECNTSITDYSVTAVANSDEITWMLSPAEAGIIVGDGMEISVEWDYDFVGIAQLSAVGTNDCGDGPVSDALDITISQTPSPEVSGLDIVCDNEQVDYAVEDVAGSTFIWDIVGGEVVAGAGTYMISVMWGEPGAGSVFVTETTDAYCVGASDYYDVTIDDCTGIDDAEANANVSLYPNPAKENIKLMFTGKAGSTYTVVVINSIGQVMTEVNGISFGHNQNVNIDINNYKSGIYIINLITKDGLNIRRTFEKVN
ncbi:MAG: PKD domain-containing protein [Bacteroidota bacterium]